MKYITAQYKKSLTSVKGFSLIELMIVVAVIAILAVIGVSIYGNVQKTARDSRRKADIDAIAAALESTKSPNAPTYGALAATSFSHTVIPTDTTTEQYSACWSPTAATTSGGTLPTTWGAVANPTAPACPGGAWATVDAAAPAANSSSWIVCAKLETGGTFYCRSNAQ